MSDVSTLIERLELLVEGQPLPGDEKPAQPLGTVGRLAENTASVRCMHPATTAHLKHIQPIKQRLACELCDNVETVLAALRYWQQRHPTPETLP